MFAMLSVDFGKEINKDKREIFNDYLKKSGWMKVPMIDTTWYSSFGNGKTEFDITNMAKENISHALEYAEINNYSYIVNVGLFAPQFFHNNVKEQLEKVG